MDYMQRWQAAMMDNYGTPPIAFVRGSGAEVWDAEGRRYLDFVAGIAVNALGHAHPAVVEAVTTQVRTLGHTSNLYITEPALELAERLRELRPWAKAHLPSYEERRRYFADVVSAELG